jgi:hypothetical protein
MDVPSGIDSPSVLLAHVSGTLSCSSLDVVRPDLTRRRSVLVGIVIIPRYPSPGSWTSSPLSPDVSFIFGTWFFYSLMANTCLSLHTVSFIFCPLNVAPFFPHDLQLKQV